MKINVGNNNVNDDKLIVKKYYDQRLTFNFSFLTSDKKYNLKNREQKVKLKIIEKIENLSLESKVAILARNKENGLEKISCDEINGLKINKFFKSTRCADCEDDFWVFRISKLGRVIGKINNNVFYILAIDTKFNLYEH